MFFGLSYPICQAPTGSIAGPELAAAVSLAGGMGAMGLTWTSPELAAEYVREVKAVTNRPFQVNYALAFPPHSLTAALEAGAPVVTFSWGDPEPYLAQVREAGTKVGIQVTNVAGAERALQLGADFLICQGVEAGGHVQSTTSLWELLPCVVETAGSVPVVAAGGIAEGEEVARALKSGASAAMLGTRFVATQESRAHEEYKRLLVDHSKTALTVCFDGGWPQSAQRVLRNTTLEQWEAAGSPSSGKRPGENDIVAYTGNNEAVFRYEDTAPRVGYTGDIGAMCLYAGQGVAAIHDIPTAAQVIERLWQEGGGR